MNSTRTSLSGITSGHLGPGRPGVCLMYHFFDRCKLRKIQCSLGCGAELLFKDQMNHQVRHQSNQGIAIQVEELSLPCLIACQVNFCTKREVTCELECGEKMFRNRLKPHMKSECPNRLVTCRVKGCKVRPPIGPVSSWPKLSSIVGFCCGGSGYHQGQGPGLPRATGLRAALHVGLRQVNRTTMGGSSTRHAPASLLL
jgi:hypothetical protein